MRARGDPARGRRAAARHARGGRPATGSRCCRTRPGPHCSRPRHCRSPRSRWWPRRRRANRGAACAGLRGERDRTRRGAHPLLPSAARLRDIRRGRGAERRALHRRLAELAPRPGGARPAPCARRRRVRTGDVAAALGHAAQRAHRRGAFAAAAELSELARRLTPAEMEESRHRRTVEAAVFAWEAGEGERARELLSEARVTAQRGPRRGEILYWLGSFQEYEGDRRKAVELYREARSNAGDDIVLRARAEEGLASALFLLRSDLSAARRPRPRGGRPRRASGGPGHGDRCSQRARRSSTR